METDADERSVCAWCPLKENMTGKDKKTAVLYEQAMDAKINKEKL